MAGAKFGHTVSRETREKISQSLRGNNNKKGKKLSEETCKLFSEIAKRDYKEGKRRVYSHWTGKKLSEEHKEKIRKSSKLTSNSGRFPKDNIPWNKGKSHPKVCGENHWNWQGGITTETNKRTSDFRWREIAQKIYRKDYGRCRLFGKYARSQIQCHHINPKREGGNDEMSNLVTLCRPHHLKLERSKFQQFWRIWLKLRIPVSLN